MGLAVDHNLMLLLRVVICFVTDFYFKTWFLHVVFLQRKFRPITKFILTMIDLLSTHATKKHYRFTINSRRVTKTVLGVRIQENLMDDVENKDSFKHFRYLGIKKQSLYYLYTIKSNV